MSNAVSPFDPRNQDTQRPVPQNPPRSPDGQARRSDEILSSNDSSGGQMEQRYESYRDARGNLVQNQEQVYDDPNARRANLGYRLTMIVYFLLGIVEVILGLRFIFRLLGASEASGFVRFLYNLSFPLEHPFAGIFSTPDLGNNSVFEASTLVAMLIYALLAWGVVTLINLLLAPRRASRMSSSSQRRRF